MVPFPKLPLSLPFGSIKEYSGLKKVKKRRYLRISTLGELLSCLTFDDRVSAEKDVADILLRESGGGKALKEETSIHVSINRLTDTAHPGKLFHLRETFTEDGFRFKIYGLYRPGATSLKEVVETFTFMGLDGFGAKKSAGKGKFAVVEEEEGWGPLESIERGGKWFISLSTGLPDKDEIEDGYGEFFTKFPKHGREVARAEVFKNPLILSRPGSLFKAKEKKPLYGSTVTISAPSLRGHRHSRLVVPLFVG
jgi:CRISPR-associated protein Csm4